ncbi:hypothetical protein BGZ63DRAFT_97996 [Mariannaea sp. PMI_226]|nr:hypothetical protein BGZ63DRAFT_97996 [Mariannaea sp. PMI_226]
MSASSHRTCGILFFSFRFQLARFLTSGYYSRIPEGSAFEETSFEIDGFEIVEKFRYCNMAVNGHLEVVHITTFDIVPLIIIRSCISQAVGRYLWCCRGQSHLEAILAPIEKIQNRESRGLHL